jgi:hypothetical protein
MEGGDIQMDQDDDAPVWRSYKRFNSLARMMA